MSEINLLSCLKLTIRFGTTFLMILNLDACIVYVVWIYQT